MKNELQAPTAQQTQNNTNANNTSINQAYEQVLQQSTASIAQLKTQFYLHEHEADIVKLLTDLQEALERGQGSQLSKSLKKGFLKLLGIDKAEQGSAQANFEQYLTPLTAHKNSMLLENAQLNQQLIDLENAKKTITSLMVEIDKVIIEVKRSAGDTNFKRIKPELSKLKIQLLQQNITINNAMLALNTSITKNKQMVSSLVSLSTNSLSAHKVHEIVCYLQAD